MNNNSATRKRKRKSNRFEISIQQDSHEDFKNTVIKTCDGKERIKKDVDDGVKCTRESPEKRHKSSFNDNETDDSTQDILKNESTYFKSILNTLKSEIPEESRDIFASNALEECKGKEIELSCYHSTRRSIQTLLSYCNNTEMWMQFMTAFANDKVTVCTNPSASHMVELLIKFAVKSLKNWSSMSETEMEEKSSFAFFFTWLSDLGSFVVEHFTDCLENQYAAHIASSVIRALGGDMSKPSEYRSKKLNKHKKDFSFNNQDEAASNDSPSTEEITLESIPKEFKEQLKLLSKKMRKIENLSVYAVESYSAVVVQVLISILNKRVPKQCKKLIKTLASNLFEEKDNNGVPCAFLDKNCSFVIEKMFQEADEDLQTVLWNEYIDQSLQHLIVHPISNFILQRLFDSVKSATLLQIMCESTGCLFNEVLNSGKFGIFLSISSACNRLKSHQALFMKNIMQCLLCHEPQERQNKLAGLLLNLKTYDESNFIKKSHLNVILQGSLLTQNLLTFQKPIKLVNSLVTMKPQHLSTLACHPQGCHVLTSFFKSDTIGEKSKDRLIQCLQPVITSIACDENGNLSLCRMWVLLSLKQKGIVAEALAREEEKLKSHGRGNMVFNKLKIFQYKRNFEQWKEFQNTYLSKKKEKRKV